MCINQSVNNLKYSKIMRCNNCGWTNNPAGSQKCEKCNAPLMGSMLAGGHQDVNINNSPQNQVPLNATIPSGVSGLPYVDAPNEQKEFNSSPSNASICKCGYPLTVNSTACPNCKTPIGNSNVNQPQKSKIGKRTIDPFAGGVFNYSGSCTLKPIENPDDVSRAISFNETTILNRSNIDTNNNSITSRQQANLEYKDGEWYITDLSEQGTTFVRKNGAIQLEDGDVILIGNRRFIFSK